MSDYEGDDWHNEEYVAGAAPADSTAEGFTRVAGPQGRSLEDFNADYYGRWKDRRLPAKPRLARSFHPKIQNIRPRTLHGTGGRPIQLIPEFEPQRYDLASFRRSQDQPDTPDHIYQLDRTWTDFITRIQLQETSGEETADKRIDSICAESGAFICSRDAETSQLYVWGTTEQVEIAVALLDAWDISFRGPTMKRPGGRSWIKQKAYDGRKEHRLMQDSMRQLEDENFYHADDNFFEFEAYLVWPPSYDLDAYLKQYETTVLKEISREFRCRFRHEKKELQRYSVIQATTELELLSAYQRLINLAKELVTEKSKGTHGNLFRLPSLESYRSQVAVKKDVATSTFTIALAGTAHSPGEQDDWDSLVKVMERRNRRELRDSLDGFIRSLHVSQCKVRLRIEFGDVNLISFQKPSNGGENFLTDDFFEMLQNPRTELSDPIFRAKDKNMHHLVEALSNTGDFEVDQEHYKVLFDFEGTQSSTRLRLESEFRPSHDVGEAQLWANRWFTSKVHNGNENILGIKVVDLDKPGFMLRADCYNLFASGVTDGAMRMFQESIKYKPAAQGLKDGPRRRSIFLPGKKDLIAVTEIAAVKFRFKDTGGSFELRREDTYDQREGRTGHQPISSRWVACYYYERWDSLMDAYANTKPGEEIKWRHELSTFFPETPDTSFGEALPRGFRNFTREIAALQMLLKGVLASLPETCGPGQSPQADSE